MSTMTVVPPLVRRTAQVMGLPISLAIRSTEQVSSAQIDRAWQQSLASLQEADRIFSTFRPDSQISRLDRGELGVDQCAPVVREVLALAEAARADSGGCFDVRRPDGTGGRRLDPSGIVKGWAAERACAPFRELDLDFCLSAGGDMTCVTRSASALPWRIGIEDPHDPSRLAAVMSLPSGAIATSGAAHRGAHITDPRDGSTPPHFASLTVIAPTLTEADVAATAAYVMGSAGLDWLRDRGWRAVIVNHDRSSFTL